MRRFIFFILASLLLSCSPANKYRNIPEVKSWESDIRNFEQLDNCQKYPSDAIMFAGSSSIRLWDSIARDMAPYPVIQRGFGGSKLSDVCIYARRIIDPHPCRAIVLFVANDITGNKDDKTPEEVASLFRYLLRTIRKSHPLTPVFWIEVTPTASRWQVWPVIKKESTLIRNICSKNSNTYFIETSNAFLDKTGYPEKDLFRNDNLHLTQKGYDIWAELIKKALDRELKK